MSKSLPVRIIPICLFLFLAHVCLAQNYWQQRVDYNIDVTVNTLDKTLEGFERIAYKNNSPDTLRFIWFHLWPNAYKNDRTAFTDQGLRDGNTRFYFSGKKDKGYINRLSFVVDGKPARTEDHPEHQDIVKLLLPKPLPPGDSALIATPFFVKLPFLFSRGGYNGSFIAGTQWYPKPAVYDAQGWHPMPYLDQGEFYSEFGNFDVRITAPANYAVAATGVLQNTALRQQWMANGAAKKTVAKKGYTSKKSSVKKPYNAQPNDTATTPAQTWHFVQDSVHDFAFFTDSKFIINEDTCRLPNGKVIDVLTYYTPSVKKSWEASVQYCKDAVRFYSREVGTYPYAVVQAVQGPQGFGGGMEYPTITSIAPDAAGRLLDMVLAHEIGHNWFYGILASNERQHPWLDEGINSFYERAYTKQKYGSASDLEMYPLQQLMASGSDQPITTSAPDFTAENYALVAYYKTAKWLQAVENALGKEKFRSTMQEYFNRWQFKHPQPENFLQLLKDAGTPQALLDAVNTKGSIPASSTNTQRQKLLFPFDTKALGRYANAFDNKAVALLPAIGINNYDRLMLGVLATNYAVTTKPVRWLVAPLYATGTKTIKGIARIDYTHRMQQRRELKLAGTLSRFSYSQFEDDKGTKYTSAVTRAVPGITYQWQKGASTNATTAYISFKSFLIGEQPLRIGFDTVITSGDTSISNKVTKETLRYAVHQLSIGVYNNRALYPYDAVLQVQANSRFTRLTATANYFFNYKEGGLAVRAFAGKFFYNKGGSDLPYGYNISRFFLNMTGPNGEEDFTYSNYFMGRTDFDGLASQQIIIRDGGFKVRTDLLANKVGKTDDWLTAINLNASVPKKFNPLAVLPIKIPLHLFADVGTYAEVWDQNNKGNSRFLFAGGLHVPLFDGLINVYAPLVYSQPYKEYIQSVYEKNRFLKSLSFSIQVPATVTSLSRKFRF